MLLMVAPLVKICTNQIGFMFHAVKYCSHRICSTHYVDNIEQTFVRFMTSVLCETLTSKQTIHKYSKTELWLVTFYLAHYGHFFGCK